MKIFMPSDISLYALWWYYRTQPAIMNRKEVKKEVFILRVLELGGRLTGTQKRTKIIIPDTIDWNHINFECSFLERFTAKRRLDALIEKLPVGYNH